MNEDAGFVIALAAAADVRELVELFGEYRRFYEQAADAGAEREFVSGLVLAGEHRFFVARESVAGMAVGFLHMMPSTNTLAMRPVWLLEDLFVAQGARRKGVAEALMRRAAEFACETGAERITLATARDNAAAQALYKKLGFVREDEFQYFHRVLKGPATT